jgi:hypothetical protein
MAYDRASCGLGADTIDASAQDGVPLILVSEAKDGFWPVPARCPQPCIEYPARPASSPDTDGLAGDIQPAVGSGMVSQPSRLDIACAQVTMART